MPGDYKTPNVYIEEIQSLPPSIVQGATAVPVFVGYTEKASDQHLNQAIRIKTMMEYENIFGKYYSQKTTDGELISKVQDPNHLPEYLLYYQLQMHFANGGGACYVLSIGTYPKDSEELKWDFDAEIILQAIAKEEAITLIVLTDAVKLGKPKYYEVCNSILTECAKLKDKFVILDVHGNDIANDIDGNSDDNKGFRNGINSTEGLKYAAAYYPYLHTSLSYGYDESKIEVVVPAITAAKKSDTPDSTLIKPILGDAFSTELKAKAENLKQYVDKFAEYNRELIKVSDDKKSAVKKSFSEHIKNYETAKSNLVTIIQSVTDKLPGKNESSKTTLENIINTFEAAINKQDIKENVTHLNVLIDDLVINTNAAVQAIAISTSSPTLPVSDTGGQPADKTTAAKSILLSELKDDPTQSKLYFETKAKLDKLTVTLPPSGAIAGIYCGVDRDRGVWKAPANVGINAVIAPSVKISDAEQDSLNIHDSGKSINAIRSFTGKGTLVWGSRTLAGNDNEWRYVPVRRLFNTIEKAIKNSTAFAVFEPNDEHTWLKVKLMIDNYLRDLWSQGALAGTKPEDAYYVHVGLGTTMTSADILAGKLITKVGIAAVRPAEFIIMQFSHLLQKS